MRVFRETLGPGPERVLGEALPEHPEVAVLEDPREGPAAALVRWAGVERVQALRWWVVPCDQVHWTREFLEDWHRAAAAADPRGDFWVAAETEQGRQVLGGFLGGRLPPALARLRFRRVGELFGALPSLTRPWAWAPFEDVDERPPTPP